MFGKRKRKFKHANITTVIGRETELVGDLTFTGGLHLDGTVKGNVYAADGGNSLTVSEHGRIEGEVHVPNIILNGVVQGDVYASERVELAPKARVSGNVYYDLLEMESGAEVNGNLVHRPPGETPN